MDQLEVGVQELGLAPPVNFFADINTYLDLLAKWSKVYNLTAIVDRDEMIVKHILDSLSVARHIKGQRFLDVGTGAGLPGIPLARLYPEQDWTLLDSNGKKTRFLTAVKGALQLDNVTVINSRVSDYQDDKGFDGIISRAFASTDQFIACSQHLCAQKGAHYAMKGQADPTQYHVETISLQVPSLEQSRCLMVFVGKSEQ